MDKAEAMEAEAMDEAMDTHFLNAEADRHVRFQIVTLGQTMTGSATGLST